MNFSAEANVAFGGTNMPVGLPGWTGGERVVYVGKEVTVCVVVTRGGSLSGQPTGCQSERSLSGTLVSQILNL